MKTFIVFAAAILATNAFSVQEEWINFKALHGKTYQNIVEETARFQIFQNTLKTIEEHNARYEAGLETWFMGVNQFSDMTSEEFSAMLKRQVASKPTFEGPLHESNLSEPAMIDWRQKSAVLEVKNQLQCGSCWAFSATGAMEGQNAIHHYKKIPLSEQQLLDCSAKYGNGDCNHGGDMVAAFEYVRDLGIEAETSYPYKGRQTTCTYSAAKTVLKIKGYKRVGSSESALKNAVGTVGPVSVAIYAEPIQHYAGGIFQSNTCSNINSRKLDHGVLTVGYGAYYWIVKNSWGRTWGESGYFRLATGSNQCGIALDASYPML